MDNQVLNALEALGLRDKEARVYLALLKAGKGSAYAIAEIAGLKKPTTYVILGELKKKGLVFVTPRAHKQLFSPKSPEQIFASAENRLSQAKSFLPELRTIASGNKPKVKTILFEGINGMREATQYGIKDMAGKELLGFYAKVDENTPKEFIRLAYDWSEDMLKNKITMRGFSPKDKSVAKWRANDSRYGRKFKQLSPQEYSSTSSIDVGDTFVRIVMNHQLQSVVIENKELAQMLRQIFEMLWKRI